MASLRLKAITKRFGKILALSRVDLHVEDGEFCVLLGPSGCGKSTLLNIIAGLIPQDEARYCWTVNLWTGSPHGSGMWPWSSRAMLFIPT
jgi:ABC-type nitrate/sulfonate/bicarbonate transport system ATPase subunit